METVKTRWLPGVGAEREEQAEHRGVLAQWQFSVRDCANGDTSLRPCPNPENTHHQERALTRTPGSGRWRRGCHCGLTSCNKCPTLVRDADARGETHASRQGTSQKPLCLPSILLWPTAPPKKSLNKINKVVGRWGGHDGRAYERRFILGTIFKPIFLQLLKLTCY